MKDPTLLPTVKLMPQQFSSPLLGKLFGLMLQLQEDGRPISLSSVEGEFSAEEMNRLVTVLNRNDTLVSEKAIRDCSAKILEYYQKTLYHGDSREALKARQEQLRNKKSYGG